MNFIRFSTWKNKLSPFLSLIYAFYYKNSNICLEKELKTAIILIFGIVLIAIWASLINNYYDINFDSKVGKSNEMVTINPFYRKLSIVISFVSCSVYCYLSLNNILTIIFFGLACLNFLLYSSSSIRLKEKPLWDLLTDGLASQFFPALFIFAFLFKGDFNENNIFIYAGSLWLFFAMGVRALIIHQYQDEEKDRNALLNTYVIGCNVNARNRLEFILLICEIIFFTIFAISINRIAFVLSAFIYLLFFLILRKYFSQVEIIYFHSNEKPKYRIFLYDAYTVFILCILGLLCIQNMQNILLVFLHVIVFHNSVILKFWKVLKEKIIKYNWV
jgi:hypothetical protein